MIRPTVSADAPVLVALAEATGKFRPIEIEALREVLADYFAGEQDQGHRAVTLESDGTIAGFAYYAPAPMTDNTWHVWWIVVDPKRQGDGLGSALLRFAEADMHQRRGRVVFIETGSQPHYEPTRRFYRKHGYEQHALLQDFYADGDSMVVFRKVLRPVGA
ncbi:MAG: GNAT family N-acetyltransferase [Gemmataceae bacterium]|nr:GNAT family N-acetyltransferase [Gemmataceae bacterium]